MKRIPIITPEEEQRVQAKLAQSINTDPPSGDQRSGQNQTVHRRWRLSPAASLQGVLTIFHRNYVGLPTIEVEISGGEMKRLVGAVSCHCSCEVGRWMRAADAEEIRERILTLAQVGVGSLRNWTPLDPTLPDWIEEDIPDWAGSARSRRRNVRGKAS